MNGMNKVGNPISSVADHSTAEAFKVAIVFLILAAVLPLLLHVHQDYQFFLALGPGGTPSTVGGYIRIKTLALFALRDPCQPCPVPRHLQHSQGYLHDLPQRGRPRPETRGIAPHRQITQKAGQAMFAKLEGAIHQVRAADDRLDLGVSCFERHCTGLFARAPAERTCRGEVCHAHPSDGSLHLTLHPADVRTALDGGWGERHPLARGGWFERFVPGGFVMIYAPHDDAELAAVSRIIRAAVWFVHGSHVRSGESGHDMRDSGSTSAEETAA